MDETERLLELGRMDLEAGYPQYAREYFEKVLALDSTNKEAREALAEIDNMLDRRRATAPVPLPEISWRQKISTWANAHARQWKFAGLMLLLLLLAWKAPWILLGLLAVGAIAYFLSAWGEASKIRQERYLARIKRLDQLQAMTPREFERFVAKLFEQMGHSVTLTRASGDEGVDIFLDGRKEIVQCKRYKGSVGQPVVRDFYGTMMHYKAERGYIVTTGTFSGPAQTWAEAKPIRLMDGMEIVKTLGMVVGQNGL